jgi:hypothetical protein
VHETENFQHGDSAQWKNFTGKKVCVPTAELTKTQSHETLFDEKTANEVNLNSSATLMYCISTNFPTALLRLYVAILILLPHFETQLHSSRLCFAHPLLR